jgi:hypothetical protein
MIDLAGWMATGQWGYRARYDLSWQATVPALMGLDSAGIHITLDKVDQ